MQEFADAIPYLNRKMEPLMQEEQRLEQKLDPSRKDLLHLLQVKAQIMILAELFQQITPSHKEAYISNVGLGKRKDELKVLMEQLA